MLKPDDRLFFIHIPKTAGTSLITLLDSHFAVDEICPAQLWSQMSALPLADIPKYRLFRGHFGGGGLDALLPAPPVCITMLREPTSLALSTYRFILREPGIPVHALVKREAMTFEQFIDDPRTRHKITNLQTSSLSFSFRWSPDEGPLAEGRTTRGAMRDWLNARRVKMRPTARFRAARRKLRECAFVGLVERFDDSMLLLAHAMGWPPPGPAPRLMVAPEDGRPVEMTESIRQRVCARNRLDSALYAFAQRLFERRFASMQRRLERFAEPADHSLEERDRLRARLDRSYAHVQRRRWKARIDRVHVDFDGALMGAGWQKREINPTDGSTFRCFTPAAPATLDLALARNSDLRLTIGLFASDGSDGDPPIVRVNGNEVAMRRVGSESGGGWVMQGLTSREALHSPLPFVRLSLEAAPASSNGQASPRPPVGVNWIDLRPAAELPDGDVPQVTLSPAQRARRAEQIRKSRVRSLQKKVAAIPVVGAPLKELYQRFKAR